MFAQEYGPEPSTPSDVMDAVCEQRKDIEAAEIRWLLSLVDLEMSSAVSYDGYPSVVSFLTARAGMTRGHARRLVTLASQLNRFPRLRRAALEGKLSVDQLSVLCPAAAAHPEEFSEFEALFVSQAQDLTVAELKKAVAYWTQAIEGPRGPIRVREGARSRLISSTDMEGMVRIDARLLPEAGEIILTAIDAIVSDRIRKAPADESDRRSRSELRADALADICSDYLGSSDRPQVGGERPHLSVLVDLPTLVGDDYTLAELASGTPIPKETLDRIACDATVRRVIFGPGGLPLDVGRATRNIPPPSGWRSPSGTGTAASPTVTGPPDTVTSTMLTTGPATTGPPRCATASCYAHSIIGHYTKEASQSDTTDKADSSTPDPTDQPSPTNTE